jgi:hypothetical protein
MPKSKLRKNRKTVIQTIMSAPVRILIMVKKGKKEIPLIKTTKSGDKKKVYKNNPDSKVVKQIKHFRPHA